VLLSFLINVGAFAGVLAAIGLLFLGLLRLIVHLVWRGSDGKRFWVAAAQSVGIAVAAFAIFPAISAPFRYERPLDYLFSSPAFYIPYRDFSSYWLAARFSFFATWALVLSASGLMGYRLASGTSPIQRLAYAIAAVVTCALYGLAALPFMEFANACLIGQGFLLKPNC
jgi:hypothetical protein